MEKDKEKIINLLITICYIIVLPILVFNLTIIIKTVVYPDKVPDIFGYKPFIVLSESMESAIERGDLVIVKEVDYDTLQKNDIIAFRNGDIVITHRIVKIDYDEKGEKYYVTKGDNVNTEDNDLIRNYSIEGKLVKRIPKLGFVLSFISSPSGMIIIVLVLLLIYFACDTIYQNKIIKKNKKELEEYRKEKKM